MLENRLDWSDNSHDETEFVIERKNGLVWEEIAEVPANTTQYIDVVTDMNKLFEYRVFASRRGTDSEPTMEASIIHYGLKLNINPVATTMVSVTKTGDPARWLKPDGTRVTGNSLELTTSDVGTLYLLVDDAGTVSEIILDDIGATGEFDLGFGLTALNNFSCRNNNVQLLVNASYIQRSGFTIDLTNSVLTEAKLSTLIDIIIIANGGTTTDDGNDYTGVAGGNYANRVLNVGTMVVDISLSNARILYQKITALEALGWTVSTVKTICEKLLSVNTGDTYFLITELEKTSEVIELSRLEGKSLFVDLYETEVYAINGGVSGKLTTVSSVAGLQDWIDANGAYWDDGVLYYLRFFSSDTGSLNNRSEFRYKGYPNSNRPCGTVIDVTGLIAVAAYSTKNVLQKDYSSELFQVQGDDLITWYDQSPSNAHLTKDSSNFLKLINNGIQNESTQYDSYVSSSFDELLEEFTVCARVMLIDPGSPVSVFGLQYDSGTTALFTILARDSKLGVLVFKNGQILIEELYEVGYGVFRNIIITYKNSTIEVYIDNTLINTISPVLFSNFRVRQTRIAAVDAGNAKYNLTDAITYFKALNNVERTLVNNFMQ